jgi:DNA processing protein
MLSTIQILTLLNIPGIGRKTVRKIITRSNFTPSTPAELLDMIDDALRQDKPRSPRASIETVNIAQHKAIDILEESRGENIACINYYEESYPALLKNIPDPPILLFAKGNYSALHLDKKIAVIGTREPTQYGREVSFRIGKTLAEKEYVVVSGLAKGCDTEAHRGCLRSNGVTIAVLAHGLDTIYPKENDKLAQEILDMRGCLVSEYSIGTKIYRNNFVDRDRIQSGLSEAIIVIETGTSGGTMHTVKHAQKQLKPIGCIVYPEKYNSEPSTQGNKKLIQEKTAFPITESGDIDQFIFLIGRPKEKDLKNQTHNNLPPENKNTQLSFFDNDMED